MDWHYAGLRYHKLGHFCRQKFGTRVWKVSVDGGFECPNVDGRLSTGGCIFCNVASFSPSRRLGGLSITQQITEGLRRVAKRHGVERVLAYFQPATNTYAPVDHLRALYEEALAHPAVIGLCIGTRPDCVPEAVLDLLAELSQRTWLCVEFGLQTIHDRTLRWMNRGHGLEAFLDAVTRSKRRGLTIGAHVILGLPGETGEDMQATARELGRLRIDAAKLHNLYVARDTRLAEVWSTGQLELPSLEQYAGYVVDFLECLPPDCVIERLSADAPAEYLLAPTWCSDKSAVQRAIDRELQRRDTWQGRRFAAVMPDRWG
jgi:radical SAM protein (TIGR01212 family)